LKTFGTVAVTEFNSSGFMALKVAPHEKDKFREFILKYKAKETDETTMDVRLWGNAKLVGTKSGGELHLQWTEPPTALLEKHYAHRTGAQISTLRGIERFLFYASEGYDPTEQELYYMHEFLLQRFSKTETNPLTGEEELIRTRSPQMTTYLMAKIIDGALNLLANQEIPDEVLNQIGEDMDRLWKAWHKWRYTNKNGDPLYTDERQMTWEEYCEVHAVCEFCGLPGTDTNPLERIHMVSKGADETAYEFPWNWLRGHRLHHQLQHSEGWKATLHLFPHLQGKYDRAIAEHNKVEVPMTATEVSNQWRDENGEEVIY
jgi:hypothetical protein